MFTKAFLAATLERAIKTFAQALIASFTVATGLTDAPWGPALSAAGLAALISVLTSVVSSGVGGRGPSLGAETLAPDVAAEADDYSPTGAVAGPASDVHEGDPVNVTDAGDDAQAAATKAVSEWEWREGGK